MLFDPAPRAFTEFETSAHSFMGYLRTLLLVILSPGEFARRMPGHRAEAPALKFAAINYIIGAWGVALFLLLHDATPSDGWSVQAFVAVAAVVASVFSIIATFWCEWAAAFALSVFAQPRDPWETPHYWSGLMRYLSGYHILTAAYLAGSFYAAHLFTDGPGNLDFGLIPIWAVPLAGIMLLWSLAAATVLQSYRTRRAAALCVTLFLFVLALLMCTGVYVMSFVATYFLLGTPKLNLF